MPTPRGSARQLRDRRNLHEHGNASGLRNMMGGGGLAYYVPDNLLRLGGSVPEAPAETGCVGV
ncbi:MAG: hypothetical protein ACKO9Z_02650 [Planctomycetota bacterium]